jgi:hypothetical protein
MGLKMEKNNREYNSSMLQSTDVYFEYLKEMKNDQAEDSDYSASFMTF